MNIASAIITLLLLAAAGVGFMFMQMLAFNGFSERDATPAMIFYIIWLIFFALIFGAVGFFFTKFLINKSFNAVLALILSIVVSVGAGLLADFGGLIISAIIASEVRQSHIKK